jgi:hydroxypyruvate isomerase
MQTTQSTKYSRDDRALREQRLRLSVAARNFEGVPLFEALERIAQIGFDTIDNFDWRNPDLFRLYQEGLKRYDLGAGVLVANKKPDVNALGCSLVDRSERDGFLHELELCAAAARKVDCSRLEVLSGNQRPGVPRSEQMDCAVETMKAALPLLEAEGMTAVVEFLNTSVDHPGYFLEHSDDAFELIRRVGSPRVLVLFDLYHVQISQGNLIERLRNNIEQIGQIHFADVPGRHEPGTGEIHFRNVFRAIYNLGDRYRGYVTAEYHPTDLSFRDLETVKRLASFGSNDIL